ncbi:hypothetical protein BAX97_11945 [Elizabethkingia meningoseptica]|nr:hypothetical protein [Elizabethkingia anophelis]OPC31992.1 hypothetical protein BAX97_11945 [Elizabethkingia meningoseptica]MDV3563672.1 hypothetical protein [Elizabethkingia anophelis]MDV3624921.1 hypothetical protein [Elizabethkingia anophelis]MDV3640708.1 hypothetical protein [Elizabethkingia anophelis]
MPELNLLLLNIRWQLVFIIIRCIKVFYPQQSSNPFKKKTAINDFYFEDVTSHSQELIKLLLRLF